MAGPHYVLADCRQSVDYLGRYPNFSCIDASLMVHLIYTTYHVAYYSFKEVFIVSVTIISLEVVRCVCLHTHVRL